MAGPYSIDLRVRVVQAIEGGLSTRQAAALFSIGIATAGAWYRLWRETGDVVPGRLGNPGGSKLDAYEDFIFGLIASQKDIALHEIAQHLAEAHGLSVQPSTIWYFLDRRGITFKKRQRTLPNKTAKMSPLRATPGGKISQTSTPPA
jgi:transposase